MVSLKDFLERLDHAIEGSFNLATWDTALWAPLERWHGRLEGITWKAFESDPVRDQVVKKVQLHVSFQGESKWWWMEYLAEGCVYVSRYFVYQAAHQSSKSFLEIIVREVDSLVAQMREDINRLGYEHHLRLLVGKIGILLSHDVTFVCNEKVDVDEDQPEVEDVGGAHAWTVLRDSRLTDLDHTRRDASNGYGWTHSEGRNLYQAA